MKGVMGLLLAAGLGLVGAISNWFYLERLARTEEQVYFIAIKDGKAVKEGDVIKSDDLERFGIPRSAVGNLENVAPKWSAVSSISGLRANRPLNEGDIILNADRVTRNYRSMAESLQTQEVARWVPIDASTVVPEHINPGDWVSFDVPRVGGSVPTPTGSNSVTSSAGGYTPAEIIGPFRVASLGTRREAVPVSGSRRGTGGSESRIAIVVKLEKDGQLEGQARRLFDAIRLSGGQGVQVQLHSEKLDDQTPASP
ncbi:MAG: hypothetical protein R3B90_05640 [Planctomycetaceae bacterium]